MEDVRRKLESAGVGGCPLCTAGLWDFDNTREVFLIEASRGANKLGECLSRGSNDVEALGKQLGVVRDAAESNRLIQLTCGNCGYTALIDRSVDANRA